MLLPNNVLPKDSLFYNGGLILQELLGSSGVDFFDLFEVVQSRHNMSMSVFIFSLDWLYLCNAAMIDDSDKVKLCT